MSNNPRRHHIIPQFYLAGFTQTGRRGSRLWVTDKTQGKVWPSTAAKAGHQRDFYKIELEDVDSSLAEQALSAIEGSVAPVIKEITSTGALPKSKDEFTLLLLFVTVMDLRGPTFRRSYENFERETVKHYLRMLAGNRKLFEAMKSEMSETGQHVEDLTFEMAKKMISDEDLLSIEVPTTASVKRMLEMLPRVYPVFAARKWTLLVAMSNARNFITSDRPVGLAPKIPDIPFVSRSPSASDVVVPLTRRMALFGHIYEDVDTVVDFKDLHVAEVNELLEGQSERFLFSANKPDNSIPSS